VRRWLVVVVAAGLCGALLTAVPAAASTAPAPAPAPAETVTPLASPPLALPVPSVPAGRFATSTAATPTPVSEIVADRTATSSTWVASNGGRIVEQSATPQFYQPAGSSSWLPIDTALSAVAGQAGWFESAANSWQASFGPSTAAGGDELVSDGGATVGFAPVGAAAVTPTVSGSEATYAGLWPAVTASYTVSSLGVDEDLVLSGASAPASFGFDVSGATVEAGSDGSLSVVAGGQPVGVVPAPLISDAAGPVSAASAGLALQPAAGPGGPGSQVVVSVSAGWLAGLPAAAFPVTIDPTYSTQQGPPSTSVYSQTFNDTASSSAAVYFGESSAGEWWGSANFPTPSIPGDSDASPWELVQAQMTLGGSTSDGVVVFGEAGKPNSSTVTYGAVQEGTPTNANASVSNVVSFAAQGGTWYGFVANDYYTEGEDQTPKQALNPTILYYYMQAPPPTSLLSPANGGTVPTTNPTLVANAPDQTDPNVFYDFKVSTTANGTGVLADSGWLDVDTGTGGCSYSPCLPSAQWTVPAGTLLNGETYYVTVQDDIGEPWQPSYTYYVAPAAATTVTSFTVKERLGAGGPSPEDQVGTAPGSTSVPAAGTPSPGVAPASVSVNMLTGNLSLAVGTHSLSTVSGPATIGLEYNSLQSDVAGPNDLPSTGTYQGLNGTYSVGGSQVGQRLDPSVDFDWAGVPPIGGVPIGSAFSVTWNGFFTVPSSGTWQLGAASDGTMTVSVCGQAPVNLSSYNPVFGGTDLSGGQTCAVAVTYTSGGGNHFAQLWAQNTSAPAGSQATLVPSDWLAPQMMSGLPAGWSLSTPAAGGGWMQADDQGSQVVVDAADGDTETFASAGGAGGAFYQPTEGSTDSLTVNSSGLLQLATASGWLYVFNQNGSVQSVTSIAPSLDPADLVYGYGPDNAPDSDASVLKTITDPVRCGSTDACEGGTITLAYGGDQGCPAGSPAGYLCKVNYWDGTSTTFSYTPPSGSSSNPLYELSQVTDPSGTSQFGYDQNGEMVEIRDPLAYYDLANSGVTGSSPTSCSSQCPTDTQIGYIGLPSGGYGVDQVTQPYPNGQANGFDPGHEYAYNTPAAGETTEYTVGFAENRKGDFTQPTEVDSYNADGELTAVTDAAGQTTTTLYDSDERPIVTVNPQGQQTSTVYDINSNVTDTYGPAPTSCFATDWPAGVSAPPTGPGEPVGYLPTAASQSSCDLTYGGETVPHTHTGYDENIAGLAAAYWSGGQVAGPPALQNTLNPPSSCQSTGWPAVAPGSLCRYWAAGADPVTATNGQWTAQFTGTISPPASDPAGGAWTLALASGPADSYKLYINGQLAVYGSQNDGFSNEITLNPGLNQFQLDFVGSSTQTSGFALYEAPGASFAYYYAPDDYLGSGVPTATTGPGYGLPTSTAVDPGGTNQQVTVTSYGTEAGLDPAYRLPTETVKDPLSATLAALNFPAAEQTSLADPQGANLVTQTVYQLPSQSGSYLQKTATILPGGASDPTDSTDATNYHYYAGDAGPLVAGACGVSANVWQGGLLEEQIDPTPDGNPSDARAEQFVYDASGRQIGERVDSVANIADENPLAGWECTNYDTMGRITSQTWPAYPDTSGDSAAARTVTYCYYADPGCMALTSPLQASVSDGSTDTVTATVDLQGRLSSYTDASGQTTTYGYDLDGALNTTATTTGGTITDNYSATTAQPTSVQWTPPGGTAITLATNTYNYGQTTTGLATSGLLTSVAYQNGTTAGLDYDANGNQDSLTFNTPTPSLLAQDSTTLDPAGQIIADDQTGNDFTYSYDGAGRLTTSSYSNAAGATTTSYSYATNPGYDHCADPGQGANTNRTSVTTTPATGPATTIDSCYNTADQLTSTIANPTSQTAVTDANYRYNSRGDQTEDAGTTLTWDVSDRLTTAATTADQTSYTYDPLNRVTTQTDTPTSGNPAATTYFYAGYTTTPAGTLTNGTIADQYVTLPGGVLVTIPTTGGLTDNSTWSYPDLHGDYTTTTKDAGTQTGTTTSYDPWGNPLPDTTPPNNTGSPNTTLAAFGTAGKTTDTTTNLIILGARPYNPAEARFLQTDPINGGCANQYTYAYGDPLNHPDLSGQDFCKSVSAQAAVTWGTVLTTGGNIGEFLQGIGIGGFEGSVIATALKYFGGGFGEELKDAGETAITDAERSGRPGATPKVAIFVPTFSFFGLPIPFNILAIHYVLGYGGTGKSNLPSACQ